MGQRRLRQLLVHLAEEEHHRTPVARVCAARERLELLQRTPCVLVLEPTKTVAPLRLHLLEGNVHIEHGNDDDCG